MDLLKQYVIYFEPPKTISEKVELLNKKISDKFENFYKSYIDKVWVSHIMVYLSSLPYKNEGKLISILDEYSKTTKPLTFTLGGFEIVDPGYIFVSVTDPINRLTQIHDDLVKLISPLRDSKVNPKYKDRWNKYTKAEKQRILDTGIPYKYHAHISIAKVDSEVADESVNLIRLQTFTGAQFNANKIKALSFYQSINTVIAEYKLK